MHWPEPTTANLDFEAKLWLAVQVRGGAEPARSGDGSNRILISLGQTPDGNRSKNMDAGDLQVTPARSL